MPKDDAVLLKPAIGTSDRDGEGDAPVSGRRPRRDLRDLLRTRSATDLELGHDGDDQPLRGDLYTPDQLARHARWLASGHEVRKGVDEAARRQRGAEGLLDRLGRNEGILESAYNRSVATAEQGERITPAAEWLVDNFYLIEQQVRLARKHLPRSYSRQLPRLRGAPGAGRPRVYDIALELIRHVDGHVDGESLQAFVRSYQSIAPLTIGELWAIPIMLRLALIENLRRVAARVAASQVDVDRAAYWSRRMVQTAGRDAKSVVLLLAEMARELDSVARSRGETTLHLSGAFVSEFSRRLQGQSPAVAFAVNWVTQILAEQGQTIEAIAQAESERQAADQVSVGNSIGSLRFLEACDWKEFVESMSVVEGVLRGDPADVYALQDFATRDEYRRAVEQIARRSGLSETLVAERAVTQARQASDGEMDEALRMRLGHVGHALVAGGRATLERAAGVRATVGQALRGLGRRAPLTLFLASIALATVAPTAAILGWSVATGMSTLLAVLLAVPMLIAISQVGVTITNWLVTALVPPRPLPRLDFSGGIPADFRTAVVVPTMLASREAVDDLVDAMEVRYLANRDEHLSFVLLSDFADAPNEHLPQDEALLDYAAAQVAALNRRHGFDSDTKFIWAHRPRHWNEGEGVYMGWERKRGKLVQFNRLLLADGDASGEARRVFLRWVGEVDALRGTKYVITLDSDTGLPRNAARKLVATMAHPLNNPIWDEALGRVVGGYGVLQPRVGVTLPSAGRSLYARLLSGDPGIDPYTRAVSDVYQDAFGEGSFIGKGIYHVEMFARACADRFAENRILSHDLIEGAFARSGLVSDVTLFEDHPSSYAADMARRHRWTRGDWQIAHFLGRSFTSAGAVRPNTLSGLSRWKIFDNLRRSLVPAAIVVTITLAWLGRPGWAWAWTLLLLGYFFLPALMTAVASLVRRAPADTDLPWTMHARDACRTLVTGLGRSALSLAMLPYEAFKLTDAVSRTLWRLVVSRRHLLEWMTSSDAERWTRQHHGGFWRTMAAGPIYATVLTAILVITAPRDLAWLSPLLALWLISPTIAWRISTPQARRAAPLGPADVWLMRKLARRTWTFFDTFLTAGDNYLPPDNYQEEPAVGVAHRTSPTNIGLSLLSYVAAHDFGYITLGGLLHCTERTLASLERLETFGGHLFNWYDTQRLEPLSPRYVSTVDSGNFVASVGVLRIALLELIDRPPIMQSTWRGIEDTIRLLLDTLSGREEVAGVDGSGGAGLSDLLIARLEGLVRDCSHRGPADLDGANLLLQRLVIGASEAVAAVAQGGTEEARRWAGEFERQATWFAQELHHLCPWVDIPPVDARECSGVDTSIHADIRLVAAALEQLNSYPTLREVAAITEEAVPASDAICQALERLSARPQTDLDHYLRVRRILADAGGRARSRVKTLEDLAARCQPFLEADFSIVYDATRHLQHIGYNVSDRRLDAAYYDLLASEQRLGSFWLVATGQLPQDHWFSLGRQLTVADGHPTLVSWSGSMFEYLMPRLLLPTYEGTLLDSSCKGAVARQIEYASQRENVPWGISESGYNATDASLVYQYRPFGVPGLGYKRGLGEDLVIAPYATALAAMVDPQGAAINMRRLIGAGYLGRYGFFEAIDFTPNRIRRGEKEAVVRSWMAHHQGMTLLSLLTVLCDAPMQRRLMSQPAMRSAELLLHERVPRLPPVFPHPGEHEGSRRPRDGQAGGTVRVFRTPHSFTPEVHLLSNGRLTTMVTAAGGGFTRHSRDGKTLAVTRWNEDATRDNWGTFIYLREAGTAVFWSNTYQPTHRRPERYEAIFSQARAEFRRRDRFAGGAGDAEVDIECHTQISVSPEDDVEVRRLTLINHGRTPRTIELTSYAEPVLADPRADAAHPAFGNLFVQTRLVRGRAAIIAERRPRSQGERIPLMIHLMAVHGAEVGQASYETDRFAFVGRGRTLIDPVAMHVERLGDSAGSVLDPVVSIRRSVRLEPGETVKVDVATGVADTNEQAHAFIERYHDHRMSERASELAWTHAQVVLRQLGATQEDAQVYGRLAGSVIYATPQRRAPAEVIARNLQAGRRQNNLWEYGISGDLPIVLVRISQRDRIDLVRQAVQAHAYWRRQGLVADLVIWNEDASGYRNELHDAVLGAIGTAGETAWLDRNGGIFLRRADQISEENKCLLQTVARVILTEAGTLAEQIDRRQPPETPVAAFVPSALQPGREIPTAAEIPNRELLYHNGLGGFTPDGKEYVIVTGGERPTPAPWSNVLGNPVFGTVVSEAGGGYTWHDNAREFRLTPWYNDPVSDTSGEAFYLRDEETGHIWSPTSLPATGTMPYVTRHGFGYSVFEYTQEGIASEVTLYVHRQEPVKFWLVRVRNTSDRRRRVSLTGYVEWCLGDSRPVGAMHVVTSTEPRTGAVLARNPYNGDFGVRVAFFDCSEATRSITGDRAEFLGRNGHAGAPTALRRAKLSGRVGAGLDPCAAIRTPINLAPGEEKEIAFVLGSGNDHGQAVGLLGRVRTVAAARRALEENWQYWGRTLGTLYVHSPDPALNVLANGWLEYQVLSCRFWARSGFYQSGGAFGFRDQLQDMAALLFADATVSREHLLTSARHQFKEGDVMHWWHPPMGKGVRTHFSDDYMWLPLVVSRYVQTTGDTGVLNEPVSFLQGPPMPPDQESVYDAFATAEEVGSLYEHCKRAINYGIVSRGYGAHGLPLMGCGDWNDGMNLVGAQGRGESVWLAWFFITVLLDFAAVADRCGDAAFGETCRNEAETLRENAEQNAWDGNWYRRAYFDNGDPLGSQSNAECQIDSLPQSWAVLCGLADPARAATAMRHVEARLVKRDARLIQLFDPPFNTSDLEPGYIKGYLPGVRENGGQYTHAAVWTVMAYARMGDARRAWELFDLINPVNHARTPDEVAVYKVEPYVVAADVYAVEPHVGRGGWTWYTGSAGWMFRLIIESLLGLRLEVDATGGRLHVAPLFPPDWPQFGFVYRFRDTHHHVTVIKRGDGRHVRTIKVDGTPESATFIRLREDRREHHVDVEVGG